MLMHFQRFLTCHINMISKNRIYPSNIFEHYLFIFVLPKNWQHFSIEHKKNIDNITK